MKKIIILLLALISPLYAKIYNSLLIRDYVQIGSLILKSPGNFNFVNVIGNANIGGSLNVQGSITINGAPISSGGSGGGGSGNVVGPTSPTTAGAVVLFTDTTGRAIEQSASNPVSGSPVTIDSSTNLSNVNNLTITGDLIIPTTSGTFARGVIKQNSTPILQYFGGTAIGVNALFSGSFSGSSNTACGYNALSSITTGDFNTALGSNALAAETTGNSNTALGASALRNSNGNNDNTGIGNAALINLITGTNNVALGSGAGSNLTSGSNNIYIGVNPSTTTQSNTTYIAGIYGTTTSSGTTLQVLVDMNGQLGTTASSVRYKKDIFTMENIKAALLKLRPVRFRYKIHDDQTIPEYGLIAEEVAQILPDLVIYNDGQPETVKYHMLPAILIKAIQELDGQDNEQQMIVDQLIQRIATLEQAYND